MTIRSFGLHLQDLAPRRVSLDRRLAPLTTYRLGGPATVVFEPASPEDLGLIGAALEAADVSHADVPVLVLGRGSNVVISDRGFDGLVVKLGAAFARIQGEAGTGVVEAGAATSLPLLANWSARRGLAGVEFTVGIPGSVGGGVRMNAGAHGGALADTLRSIQCFDVLTGRTEVMDASTIGLGYRRSTLRATDVVTGARFELVADDAGAIRTRIEQYRKHRAETQPGALQNAGSTFKNPPGDAAGRLVEAAGLKGHSCGGAQVSQLHANFFVASDEATAQDVYDLVHEVRRKVAERTGVELEPEVSFIGPFDSSMAASGSR